MIRQCSITTCRGLPRLQARMRMISFALAIGLAVFQARAQQGTPPCVHYSAQRGYDGALDDLAVDARCVGNAPDAGLELPASLPPSAAPEPAVAQAVHLRHDAEGATVEVALRKHLSRVIESQQCGGWHAYYDIETGRAIRMAGRKVLPADPPHGRNSWPFTPADSEPAAPSSAVANRLFSSDTSSKRGWAILSR